MTGKVIQGVREDPITDIDLYYNKIRVKALHAMKSNLKAVEVVMLCTNSAEVKDFIKKRTNATRPSVAWSPTSGKNKFDAYKK